MQWLVESWVLHLRPNKIIWVKSVPLLNTLLFLVPDNEWRTNCFLASRYFWTSHSTTTEGRSRFFTVRLRSWLFLQLIDSIGNHTHHSTHPMLPLMRPFFFLDMGSTTEQHAGVRGSQQNRPSAQICYVRCRRVITPLLYPHRLNF